MATKLADATSKILDELMTLSSTSLLTDNEYKALYAPPSPNQISTTALILSAQEEAVLKGVLARQRRKQGISHLG